MLEIKKILLKNKPFLYLLFDNDQIRILDVRKLNCQFCLEKFLSVQIDELGGLEWDPMHSIEADMVYKLTYPISKEQYIELIKHIISQRTESPQKMAKAIESLL